MDGCGRAGGASKAKTGGMDARGEEWRRGPEGRQTAGAGVFDVVGGEGRRGSVLQQQLLSSEGGTTAA